MKSVYYSFRLTPSSKTETFFDKKGTKNLISTTKPLKNKCTRALSSTRDKTHKIPQLAVSRAALFLQTRGSTLSSYEE